MLCEDYEGDMLVKDIMNKYGICNQSVTKLMKYKNVELRKAEDIRKYTLNENYFDKIDTELKAYYLGLFYADGTNREDRGYIGITLQEKDKYIIEKLFRLLDYQRPLTKIYNKTTNKYYYMGNISSRYLSNKFVEYGCMQNKSFKITFPDWLDKKLVQHFIRGYFDGDGGISISNRNIRESSLNFAGNSNFITSIQEILINECDINKTKLSKKNEIRILIVSGKYQVSRVLEYLYDGATIFLDRKHEKYLKLKDNGFVTLKGVLV